MCLPINLALRLTFMKMKNQVSYQSLVHLAKASEIMTSFGFLSTPLCERDLGLLWTWKSSWYNESRGFSVPWDKSGIRDDCVKGYDFSGRNKFESWSKKSISCIFVKTITGNRFCSKGLGIMLFVLFKNDFCFLFPDCIYDRGFEDYLGYFFHLCWQE